MRRLLQMPLASMISLSIPLLPTRLGWSQDLCVIKLVIPLGPSHFTQRLGFEAGDANSNTYRGQVMDADQVSHHSEKRQRTLP